MYIQEQEKSIDAEQKAVHNDRSTSKGSLSEVSLIDNQEIVCNYFCQLVITKSPHDVLKAFQGLFIELNCYIDEPAATAIYRIIKLDYEFVFHNTLKRCCYILINNWNAKLKLNNQALIHIHNLVEVLAKVREYKQSKHPSKQRLHQWLNNFLKSEDYAQLKLLAPTSKIPTAKTPAKPKQSPLRARYISYFLASQALDPNKTEEERAAARASYQRLQEKFKFDLAMYTARSQSSLFSEKNSQNPTGLGNNVLDLIQKVLAKRGAFSHSNLANIFLKQTKGLVYYDFKLSLVKYLTNSLGTGGTARAITRELLTYLKPLYEKYDDQVWNDELLIRTCNRLLEFLTSSKNGKPSKLFTLLASQERTLIMVLLLLKLVLICKQSRHHLEFCIVHLIKYYDDNNSLDCQWFSTFLETLEVALTISLENVHYDVVKIVDKQGQNSANSSQKNYWVFPQIKQHKKDDMLAG